MWVETGRGWHGTWPYESHFCLNFECLWVHFCLKVCVYLLPSVPQTHSTSTAVLGLSTGYVRQHGKNYSEILRLTIDLLLVVGSQASSPHISAIIFHAVPLAGEAIFAGHAEGTQRNHIIITQICFDVIMMLLLHHVAAGWATMPVRATLRHFQILSTSVHWMHQNVLYQIPEKFALQRTLPQLYSTSWRSWPRRDLGSTKKFAQMKVSFVSAESTGSTLLCPHDCSAWAPLLIP